jgi:hypothetical protein
VFAGTNLKDKIDDKRNRWEKEEGREKTVKEKVKNFIFFYNIKLILLIMSKYDQCRQCFQ